MLERIFLTNSVQGSVSGYASIAASLAMTENCSRGRSFIVVSHVVDEADRLEASAFGRILSMSK